ncbi:hypothetical protein BsWGS_18654 [Bradybaena similaris]
MATASTTLASTQLASSNLQSEYRQGSRKRKQDMPSAAALMGVTITPSSVQNHESLERMPQENTKSLSACIKAVVSFGFQEDLVKRCAEDLQRQGKLLNASTLYEECESRCPPETQQSSSYSEKVRTNNNSDSNDLFEVSDGATALPADLNESSLSPSTNTTSVSNPSSHPSSSGQTNGEIHREFRSNSSVESAVANQAPNSRSNISAQSRQPPYNDEVDGHGDVDEVDGHGGVDVVDGHLLLTLSGDTESGPNGSAEVDNADSCALSNQNMSGELSSSRSLNMPSSAHRGLYNGLSRPSRTSTDSEHSTATNTNRDTINRMEQATAHQRKEGMAAASHSFSRTAEYTNTCFRLIEREHELLEKSRKCSQCSEKPREVTFLPCGHFTVCRRCAEPIYVCPSCNKSILATVDTYLS